MWTPKKSLLSVSALSLSSALALASLHACTASGEGAPPEDADAAASEASVEVAPGTVLAEMGDEQVTMADITERAGEELAQMENSYLKQRHDLIQKTLNEVIRNQVFTEEARARGININELVSEEESSSPDVTDADIEAWYETNRVRLGGRTLDQLRDQIADLLRGQRREEVLEGLQERLSEKYGVVDHLEPFRVHIDNGSAPARGPEDAPVTLVEFSDFECPFCGRFFSTLRRIEETYGDDVRVVYRQFPIPNLHPNAFKAAEASLCADEQGRFWELHDLMFNEQQSLEVRDLKEKAGRLGLDQAAFDECLDRGRYTEQVQADQSVGRSLGVTGTPALFVNGIPVEGGAVAFDVVAEVIDQELARTGG